MSVRTIQKELAAMDPEDQEKVMSFLEKLRKQREKDLARKLSDILDNTAPEDWVTEDEFKRRLAEKDAEEEAEARSSRR